MEEAAGEMRLALDLKATSANAFGSAIEHLERSDQTKTVEIQINAFAWHVETCATPMAAAHRLADFLAFQAVDHMVPLTVRQRPELERATRPGPISRAIDRALRGERRLDAYGDVLSRILIYRQCERTGQWITVHAGGLSGAAQVFGPDWIRNAPGRPYEIEQPGERFSRAVMVGLRWVCRNGRPRLDDVRGIVKLPNGEKIWVSYQRLAFPLRTPKGAPLLASLTDVRDDISIPFMRR